jgi:two-component system, LuxR family, response regulator FixJ
MIYLIDDDKSVRRGFELFFKSEGMDFKSTEGAEDFLSQFKPGKADILVLDLNLPGMNGCDLLDKLRSDGIQIPVIVVTAFDDPQSREFCRMKGVKAYLRKPVDGDALVDTIKYIILSESHIKSPHIS